MLNSGVEKIEKFVVIFDLFADFNEGNSRVDVYCGMADLVYENGLDKPVIFDKMEIQANVTSGLVKINQGLALSTDILEDLTDKKVYKLICDYEDNLRESIQELVESSYGASDNNIMDFQQEMIKDMVRKANDEFNVMDIAKAMDEEYKQELVSSIMGKINEICKR